MSCNFNPWHHGLICGYDRCGGSILDDKETERWYLTGPEQAIFEWSGHVVLPQNPKHITELVFISTCSDNCIRQLHVY